MGGSGSGRVVFVSGGGTHYHYDQRCKYLTKGQRHVELRGGEVAVVRRDQLRSVVATHDPCKWCVIAGHTAKDDVPYLEPGDLVVADPLAMAEQRVAAIAGSDRRAVRDAERARDLPRIAAVVRTRREALLWIRLGFTESMVRGFLERSWTLTRAIELREQGFAPVQIQRWIRNGCEGERPAGN